MHYLVFDVGADLRERVARGPVTMVMDHPLYREDAELRPATRAELARDLER